MSALAWLFGLGFLALAGPLLFHLIRRTPKGEVPFSSLMFLRPTPPTLTRRSRLDNLLLLALRMAAVALIAAAFMRPFFNSNVKLDFADVPGRKTAVLIDTSASMKRADLWEQARKKLDIVLDQADANDEIAVFTFDSQLKKRIDYTKKSNAAQLRQIFDAQMIEPTWNASKLGDALVGITNQLLEDQTESRSPDSEDESTANESVASKLQVVVISDMQTGSTTTALQSFRWPEQVKVRFDRVTTKQTTNATLELLPIDESDPQQNHDNVLVRNAKGSDSDQFSVSWEDNSLPATPFLVPAGSSKILRVSRDATSLSSSKLILSGDDAEFDNQFFAIPPLKQTVSITYLGDESPNDPEGMFYYFKRSLIETPTTTYDLQQQTSSAPAESNDADFLVVARPVTDKEQKSIDELLKRGVTLLVVLWDQSMLESTQQWTGVTDIEVSEESNSKQNYAMLGNIDFSHPAFAPFSGPRFNDFTEIRFWEFLRPNLPDNVHVLARFDDDTPAIWNQFVHNKSDIYILGSGWQPAKSQLALSSKFLPLMMRMIELATKTPPVAANNIVGESVVAPVGYDRLESPDGNVEFIDAESNQAFSSPGIYAFKSSTDSQLADLKIAVNIDPAESQIAMMPDDQVSALGVEIGMHNTSDEEVEQQRKLLDYELENRQKLWKWLVLGAIGLIVGESWLAGRTDRRNRMQEVQSE